MSGRLSSLALPLRTLLNSLSVARVPQEVQRVAILLIVVLFLYILVHCSCFLKTTFEGTHGRGGQAISLQFW